MPSTIRAFIAIELPDAVRAVVRDVQQRLRTRGIDAKWVRPENLHLTLRFLGDIAPEQAAGLGALLGRATCSRPRFSLAAQGLGVFPGMRRPRVLWCGLGGDLEALSGLHAELAGGLAAAGFPDDDRPFRGHLTLARFKGPLDTGRLLAAIEAVGTYPPVPFAVERVCLLQSQLTNAGPIYTRLAAAGLK